MRIGLCLPGGGAKGSYQAGVIKALSDNNINKFDAISGTSIGAVNGYLVFTGNVEKMEYMWINLDENSQSQVKILNNTVDNSYIIDNLKNIDNNIHKDTKFYVNYVEIRNKNVKEVVKDVSTLNKEDSLDCVKYSSLLPFNPTGKLPLKEQFIKDVSEDLYEGCNLDGGLVRNILIEPLLEENLDKIILIAMRHDYKLPEELKYLMDEDKIIIVRPKTEFTSNDTLNFNKEFCNKMFKEGYEIGKSINLGK